MLIGTDGYFALCHQLPQLLHRHIFLFCYNLHLFRDNAFSCGIHLGGVILVHV